MQIGLVALSFVCNLILGILLAKRAKQNIPRLALAISILAISAWNFSVLMLIKEPGVIHPPAIWGKLASTFGVFIPMGLLWFSRTFRSPDPLEGFKDHYFILVTMVVALFTLPDNFLFKGELTLTQGGIGHQTNFYSIVIGIYYLIYFGLAFLTLFRKSKKSNNKLVKSQINFLGVTSSLIALFILLTNMFLPIFNINNFNGIGPVLSIAFTASLFYITTNTRLIDLKLILQQSLSYISAALLTGLAVYSYTHGVGYYSDALKIFLVFISILMFYPFMVGFNRLFNYALFRETENYKEKLRKININVHDGQDLKGMVNLFMSSVQDALKITGASLLFFSKNNSYVPVYAQNISAQKLHNPYIVNWLKNNKTIFVRDEILYQNQDTDFRDTTKKSLDTVDTETVAAIYIPIIQDNILHAIIVLEDKINNASFKFQEIKEIELIVEKFTFFFVGATRYEQIKEEMEDSSKIKEYFHHGLFHEVNTPLTIANNFIEMAKWSTESKENMQTLENAQEYVHQSSNIIKGIVELNKHLSGDTELQLGKYKTNSIIQKTFRSPRIKDLIKKRKIDFKVKNVKALQNEVFIDKDQFVEALSNILVSVIESNNLKKCTIPLGVKLMKNTLVGYISFKNNNKTLTEYLKFPSYRIDKWLDTKKGNEGIGLAISKAIIERHHGQINVSSKMNQTKVELIIPLHITPKEG